MTHLDIHKDKLLILDFGSQYTQLIARRIREIGVYCEIFPYHVDAQKILDFKPKGVILSGGPQTVTVDDTPRIPEVVFEMDVPILGICYGMQALANQLGGQVETSQKREYGFAEVHTSSETKLLQGLNDSENSNAPHLKVWMSHGDKVTSVPEGFQVSAHSQNAPFCAIENDEKKIYGLQFHPEVTHTLQGKQILKNFVEICEADTLWTAKNIAESFIEEIQASVSGEKVLLALSGGVDSSVVAALLHQAIGDNLYCVFVDTGLMRYREVEQVIEMFEKNLGVHLIHVDAKQKFLGALKGVDCPEAKRKIIGAKFIEVFDEEALKLKGIKYLAQGTIYPDVIESAVDGQAHVIKSHHNVGGLPDDLAFELVEPIRELFKDEVRTLGLQLGLPYDMVYRHPFPGPGLGVRVLGEVEEPYIDILRLADNIFIEELRRDDLYHKVSQAFAVFLPVKSVGVMGDARQYDYVIALRAVETIDFMTAHWAHLPHEFLSKVSNRIINEVKGVSRVVYDVSGKPPATIEWE